MKYTLLMLTLMALALLACSNVRGGEQKTNANGIPYKIVVIEGMPCLTVENSSPISNAYSFSITCDWSKWDGGK